MWVYIYMHIYITFKSLIMPSVSEIVVDMVGEISLHFKDRRWMKIKQVISFLTTIFLGRFL